MARLLRAISENGGIVFYAVDSTDIVREAERIHKTSGGHFGCFGKAFDGSKPDECHVETTFRLYHSSRER